MDILLHRIFFHVSDFSIVVCFVLSVLMLLYPYPKEEGLKNFRISARLLSANFFLLGTYSCLMRIFNLAESAVEIIPYSTLIVATLQVMLYALSMINLLNPKYSTRSSVLKQLSPMVFFTLAYIISVSFVGDVYLYNTDDLVPYLSHPTVILRIVFFLFFLLQILYYSVIFIREERNYRTAVDNYYSDYPYTLRLEWIIHAYYSAFIVAIVAVIYSVYYHLVFQTLFVAVYTIFYSVFSLNYLRYTNLYPKIRPVILDSNMIISEKNEKEEESEPAWSEIKQLIISDREYLVSGITISDLAEKYKIPRKTLSALINNEEQVNFNTWINQLRIDEAKQLLLSNPEIPLAEVADSVGFTELSNFSRQFKIVTNTSPSIWRQSYSYSQNSN